ncbi:hypothetical protein MNEG_4174 [Monoraphidium neglectum]|uniref:FAS1 domain-containing protein n=1 Tax=Monoraphidium neglectum TaxID=145388 RepID=A0A0D2MLP5_9CHLO|nr:hypothetical protein MNEG_4174 [Monoraphidium neglectum]KIZ03785.1 hypothetical protein MNEG_4174 [Monoraphidium neglectum]|eukprot:XP_013902804.1 hypothetical protein MNEG_4174 [Monoraphidium neglectum]
MRVLLASVVLLALAGAAVAQTAAALAPQSTSADGKRFWKDPLVAAKANNLTAFASTVEAAGLADTVGAPDLVATVFAPSNAAFKALQASTDPVVQDILNDKTKLAEVLKYHVVPGATIGAARIKTLIAGAKGGVLPFKTLEGEKVNATLKGATILVNDVPVSGGDVQGGKTLIHVIDDVLIPPTLLTGAAAPAASPSAAAVPSAAPAATGAPVTAAPASSPAPAAKPTNSAGRVAAGLLLAVPAAIAAVL